MNISKNMRNKLDSDIKTNIRNFLGKEGIDFLKESKENGINQQTIMENRIKQIKIEVKNELLSFSFYDEKDEIITWDKLTDEEKNFVVDSMQQGVNLFRRFLNKH